MFLLMSSCVLKEFGGSWDYIFSVTSIVGRGKTSNFLAFYVLHISLGVLGHGQETPC